MPEGGGRVSCATPDSTKGCYWPSHVTSRPVYSHHSLCLCSIKVHRPVGGQAAAVLVLPEVTRVAYSEAP